MRSDIKKWMEDAPAEYRQVGHEMIMWGTGMSLHARVFDLGPSLLVSTYTEPRTDLGLGAVPDGVMDRLQCLLEPWRKDPRPWMHFFMDEGLCCVEWPDESRPGFYRKAWAGRRDHINKIAKMDDSADWNKDPSGMTMVDAYKKVCGWMGLNAGGGQP